MPRNFMTAGAVLFGGLLGWPSGAHAQDVPLVFRVPVTGVVEMGLAPFIERAIREAEDAGVSVIVLDIDTPGGRVDSAERIADAISDSARPGGTRDATRLRSWEPPWKSRAGVADGRSDPPARPPHA